MELIAGLAIGLCVFGFLGLYVATQKNRPITEGFILGLAFGPLGVIVEACLPVGTAAEDRKLRAQAIGVRDRAQRERLVRFLNVVAARCRGWLGR